jgi:nucleoside-diphosphate-sugar epimerase
MFALMERFSMTRSVLIIGATGIVGYSLAQRLVADGWVVYGLARRPPHNMAGVIPVAADLLDLQALRVSLDGLKPSHVVFCSWMRQATETENCKINGAIVRNVFAATADPSALHHVALVTGLKHYLGPFEAYATGPLPQTPFREETPRLSIENFYYNQEDELFEASQRLGFSWSVHRPHTIIGYAIGNAMNMGMTLAIYASICRETGRPFLFPGSPQQWHGLTDVTDARQLARHIAWASTSAAGKNQAFNITNGDIFRWNWLWPRLAKWFGIDAADYLDHPTPLERQMIDDGPIWSGMARKYHLIEPQIERLVSAWHTDADLGRPIECVTDMSKSRAAGFTDYQSSLASFTDLFARLRAERIIP